MERRRLTAAPVGRGRLARSRRAPRRLVWPRARRADPGDAAPEGGRQARPVPEARAAAAAALRDAAGAVRARRPVAGHDPDPLRGAPPRRHRTRRRAADLRRRGRAGLRLDRQRPLLRPHVRAGAPPPRPGAWSTCAAPATRGRSTARSSRRGTAPTARASPSARGSSATTTAPTGPRPPPTTSTPCAARSGSTGSRSTATPTAPTSASPTPSAMATRSPPSILDSAYPVRGESPWYPSLWRNGIRALQIACDRARGLLGQCQPAPAARRRPAPAHPARGRPAARRDRVGRLRAAGAQLPQDRPGDQRLPARRPPPLQAPDRAPIPAPTGSTAPTRAATSSR